MQHNNRIRIWFWALFLSAVFAIYIFGIYPRQHLLAQSRETADILQPRIAADSRFAAVRVSRATNGGVYLVGEVHSQSDLDALTKLVEDAKPPRHPGLAVRVGQNPK